MKSPKTALIWETVPFGGRGCNSLHKETGKLREAKPVEVGKRNFGREYSYTRRMYMVNLGSGGVPYGVLLLHNEECPFYKKSRKVNYILKYYDPVRQFHKAEVWNKSDQNLIIRLGVNYYDVLRS